MNDINDLDTNDEGLKAVMGDKFQDVTKGSQKPKVSKVSSNTTDAAKKASKEADELAKRSNAIHCTFLTPANANWMDSLKECVKKTCLYAGISILIFYWTNNGLMDASIAIPCNSVLLLLTGYCVGKCFSKGVR